MYHRDIEYERDELRAEFTVWLGTLIRRAKLNYLRKQSQQVETVSLDEIPEESLPLVRDSDIPSMTVSSEDFDFAEERLANAFAELPLMRQQILKMLFIDEMKAGEIAKKLNCSPKYVSNQRLKGLKHLRERMTEGGDEDG